MIERRLSRFHHITVMALSLFLILFIGGVVLLWSWNTVASQVSHIPDIQFKHALAMELFLFVVFFIQGTVSKISQGGVLTQKAGGEL